MIEPLAVAVHGVKQMGDVTGMNIVVIGAGRSESGSAVCKRMEQAKL